MIQFFLTTSPIPLYPRWVTGILLFTHGRHFLLFYVLLFLLLSLLRLSLSQSSNFSGDVMDTFFTAFLGSFAFYISDALVSIIVLIVAVLVFNTLFSKK